MVGRSDKEAVKSALKAVFGCGVLAGTLLGMAIVGAAAVVVILLTN